MPNLAYLLIGLVCGTLSSLALLLWWRASNPPRPLAEVERRLSESFSKANLDMAARVEQIKGDLRSDLADRLQMGFDHLRDSTESKLAALADKQTEGLRESRRELTATLNTLGTGLQDKFDKLREAQAGAARDGRAELARSLGEAMAGLGKKFESLETRTTQDLEKIRSRVDERLQSISDQVQQKLEKNIQEGFAHFQKVQEHLKAAEEQLRNVGAVGQSINELNSLLKLPHLRGKFGEAELGKLLADFLPAGAFEEQATIVPDSKDAVDAIVRFPQAKLPIDSKFNREQILPLFESSDPQLLKDARKQLATVIKQEAQSIREKYIHPEHGTTDLALMFLPSETIYFEVLRDIDLCESLHRLSVFPVSPNTLAITLKSIAMSFGFYEFSKNVEKTLEQIKQAQRSFGLFQKKFEEVGKGLEKAQEAYGTAAGHLNRYTNKVVKLTGETVPEIEAAPPGSSEADSTGELLLDSSDRVGK